MVDTVTVAQETVTCALIIALLLCIVCVYALFSVVSVTPVRAVLAGVVSFVFSAYVVPHATACWLGKNLDEIFAEP